jgi:hypothetical protein
MSEWTVFPSTLEQAIIAIAEYRHGGPPVGVSADLFVDLIARVAMLEAIAKAKGELTT